MKPWDDPRVAAGMKRQLARRRERLAAGEVSLGWKLGFNPPAAMQMLNVTKPLTAPLLKRALVRSGEKVSLKDWLKPVADSEIAIHMGKDLPAGANQATIMAAIAGLSAAIELVELDIPPKAENVEAILAGDIYQRHVVLGAPDASRAGGKVAGLKVRALRNGVEVGATSDPEASIGKVLDLVRHLADTLDAFGERLRAGEVIITGHPFPLIFIEASDRSFACDVDPIGDVSVRFSA